MIYIIPAIVILGILAALCYANLLEAMIQDHEDYKGEDFLNWDEDDKNQIS